LSRARIYNDERFCKNQPPPKDAPIWACKLSDSNAEMSRRVNETETTEITRHGK